MSNMDYCKFQNTLQDLRQCRDNWETESEDEEEAQKKLIQLCEEIVNDYK